MMKSCCTTSFCRSDASHWCLVQHSPRSLLLRAVCLISVLSCGHSCLWRKEKGASPDKCDSMTTCNLDVTYLGMCELPYWGRKQRAGAPSAWNVEVLIRRLSPFPCIYKATSKVWILHLSTSCRKVLHVLLEFSSSSNKYHQNLQFNNHF